MICRERQYLAHATRRWNRDHLIVGPAIGLRVGHSCPCFVQVTSAKGLRDSRVGHLLGTASPERAREQVPAKEPRSMAGPRVGKRRAVVSTVFVMLTVSCA